MDYLFQEVCKHVCPMGWLAMKDTDFFFLAPKVKLSAGVELWDISILFFLFHFYI